MKRQIAWCLTFLAGTWAAVLIVGAFMEIAPGFLPLFPLAVVCWFARDMTWEHEFALAMSVLDKKPFTY